MTRYVGRAGLVLAALSILSSPTLAQQYKPSFPRDGATKLLENEFVTLWDVTYEKGKSAPMQEQRYDQVSLTMSEGAVKVTRPDNTWTVDHSRFATVRFEPKGTITSEEGVSDKPRREIVVELKDYDVPTLDPPLAAELRAQDMRGQFPREEATKILETDRIIVWDNQYRLGPGARHAHYNQVVGVWIEAGTLNHSPRTFGQVNFRAPGPPHEEEAGNPLPRAIFIEYQKGLKY
jgi:hypothetical protein